MQGLRWAVGDHMFVEFLLQALSCEGVDVSHVRQVGGASTGLTLERSLEELAGRASGEYSTAVRPRCEGMAMT